MKLSVESITVDSVKCFQTPGREDCLFIQAKVGNEVLFLYAVPNKKSERLNKRLINLYKRQMEEHEPTDVLHVCYDTTTKHLEYTGLTKIKEI